MHKITNLLSVSEFPIRWVDVDAYQHVGQTRYLDAMTEARAQWLNQIATEKQILLHTYQFYVVDTQCTFYKSFKYPGAMQVKQYLHALQRSNFTLQYQFTHPEEERLYAQGTVRLACIDAQSAKPIRLPATLAAALTYNKNN